MSAIREPKMVPLSKEFVPPEGLPSTPDINQRTMAAVARLQVRGVVPQPNPLVTSWQLHALIRVLARKSILAQKDIDDISYFTALLQCLDLERLVTEKPTNPILVPKTVMARPPNGH